MKKIFDIRDDEISIHSSYWKQILINQKNALLLHWSQLVSMGVLDNFSLNDRFSNKKHNRRPDSDSLLYKWIGATSSLLLFLKNDPESFYEYNALQDNLETAITLIEQNQLPNGYIDTYNQFAFKKGYKPKSYLTKNEMINLTYLIHAGINHFMATQSQRLISISQKVAHLIITNFINTSSPRIFGNVQFIHALIALYDITDNESYLLTAYRLLAKNHIKIPPLHSPLISTEQQILSQTNLLALYDRMNKTNLELSPKFLEQAKALISSFKSFTIHNMCYHGVLNEELSRKMVAHIVTNKLKKPNHRNSSASAAYLLHFLDEMFKITKDPVYPDIIEWLFNNALTATFSQNGQIVSYFQDYFTPEQIQIPTEKNLEDCFCKLSPISTTALLANLAHYIYHEEEEDLYILQLVENEIYIPRTGTCIQLFSNLPNKDEMTLRIVTQTPRKFKLHIRIPSWVEGYAFYVNGKKNDASEIITPPLDTNWAPHWFDAAYLTINMDEAIESKSIQIIFTESIRYIDAPVSLTKADKKISKNYKFIFRNGQIYYFDQEINPQIDIHDFKINLNNEIKSIPYKELFADTNCTLWQNVTCLLATTQRNQQVVLLPWAVQANFPHSAKQIPLPTVGGIGNWEQF